MERVPPVSPSSMCSVLCGGVYITRGAAEEVKGSSAVPCLLCGGEAVQDDW
jgi:hypothetical protein